MDLLGDGSLQTPSKSLLKPGLHIGEAFATPCALLSSSSIADIQVNSLISHLSILLMLLMLMLLMLSTKDRIRNGPQPISNLMSNSNRCCHQLLAHQSLAHHQSLLFQPLLYQPLLDQPLLYQALLDQSLLDQSLLDQSLLDQSLLDRALLEPSSIMSMEAAASEGAVLLMSVSGANTCILSASKLQKNPVLWWLPWGWGRWLRPSLVLHPWGWGWRRR